jgi:hypothetical protein
MIEKDACPRYLWTAGPLVIRKTPDPTPIVGAIVDDVVAARGLPPVTLMA